MSHEFRTPLNSILALSRLLLDRVDGQLTDGAGEAGPLHPQLARESLLELVNDLLDLAQVEAGKTTVTPGRVQVDDLFGLLRGMLRPLLPARRSRWSSTPQTGFRRSYTDEAKVAQILRNFISNALKFTIEGEVRVSCRYDEERATAIFEVADTGVGIAPEDRLMIFDEFVQIENALQAGVRGSGLGLAVCQRLTAVLGGRLDVESSVGVGSTFRVEIPIVYHVPDDLEEPEPAASADAARERGGGRSALVIDDDEVARYLATRTLRSRGYDVAEATDGLSGLEAARERRPDVIVLDLKMPELDGFIVLQELKMDFRTAEIPVVIQTAKAVTSQERSLLSAAVAIVDKREAGRGSLATVIEALDHGE